MTLQVNHALGRSVAVTAGEVEHNFWGGPTYVHGRFYVQLDNNGSAAHREMTDLQSPAGAGGDELRGTRAEWFGFRGRHDESGEYSTVVMVDDTANPRHPPQWFARSEEFACLCPAPFFGEELTLPDGQALRFRYAVVIADGDRGEDGTALLAKQGRDALA
ncbi:DUF6807 family protein [Nonomuraea purpurea]|uniref:DUF6807 family protein n=1 Tax=Nonomuraea purpurea TaxID=1849276 RepID=A0ABV8FZI6_9ACTN